MSAFKTPNDNQVLLTELMYSDNHKLMQHFLERYVSLPRVTTQEEALAKFIFDDIEAQSLTILAVCTVNGDSAPIESLIGMISSALLKRNLDAGKVIATHNCVAEFIIASTEIFPQSRTFHNKLKVKSIFFDYEKATKRLFQLPSTTKATKRHKPLGKFQWNPTTTEAVDKLNRTPLVVLDFDEQTVPPEGTEDRVKYEIRKALRPHFAQNNTPLYFDWHMDYRGRMYAGGYHFNPQGNEYEKNIMAFRHGVDLSKNDELFRIAEHEIICAIAVAFGKDKSIDSEKLEWFSAIEEAGDTLHWQDAKEPTYARAQLESLRRLRTTGITNIPVELDSTCSQKQMIAVLTGDIRTAACCNILTDNSYIQDAYKMVADELSKLSGLKFNRSQIKKSDMIDGYGAGKELVTKQLQEDLKDMYFDGVVELFYKATNNVCPVVSVLKSTFQGIWDNQRTHWSWTLPDGFVTDYRTVEPRVIQINPFGQGTIEVITNLIVPTARNAALGVNIIHSVDAYVCRQMELRCQFDIITIHDGFRCLPHNAPEMRRIYNSIMAEIADSTLLEDILTEITGNQIEPLKKILKGEHIMHSEYAIS